MKKLKLVVLSGAGISAESGIATFRSGETALWNNHKIADVCTAEAWQKNPTKVNDFYNERRIEVLNASPNSAHIKLAEMEKYFNIQIITSNVDDLHERAGSTNVLHIHGEILKARSSHDKYDWMGMSDKYEINNPKLYDVGRKGLNYYSDYADDGFPLRPAIVMFGESVPKIEDANDIMKTADILIVVGTSLSVYPAASLVNSVPDKCKSFYVDPANEEAAYSFPCRYINADATKGIPRVFDILNGM